MSQLDFLRLLFGTSEKYSLKVSVLDNPIIVHRVHICFNQIFLRKQKIHEILKMQIITNNALLIRKRYKFINIFLKNVIKL